MHNFKMEINTIFNEDCLITLSKMESNSIDLIITSPPYNNWRNRRIQKNKENYWNRTNIIYDTYDDKKTDEDYEDWQINILNECVRVLKPTGTIVYNHKDKIYNFKAKSPLEWILKSNCVYRQRITWDRGGMQAFNPVRFYRVEEDIYILGKNATSFKWNKNCAKYLSIWKIPPSRKTGHPASFPLELPLRCIDAFSYEGDIIYDPFMGIGTTALAALLRNRTFFGSEISTKYCRQMQDYLKFNGIDYKNFNINFKNN